MLVALHADDLGFSPSINDGICDALRRGLLTGASVLANAPAATAALAAWRRLEDERAAGGLPSSPAREMLADPRLPFDLGVHLNLSQGQPLTGTAFPPALLDRQGNFLGVATFARLMLPGAGRHAEAVRRELEQQIEFVLDHAVRPTRLDGHQYCELTPLVGRIVHDLAVRHGIASVRVAREPGTARTLLRNRGLRGVGGIPDAVAKRALAAVCRRRARHAGLRHSSCFFGSATAGRVGLTDIDRFLSLAAARNTALVEIGLHPGLPPAAETSGPRGSSGVAGPWHDPLATTRPAEHRWLVGPELPEFLRSRQVRLGRVG
jgi:predicted glycoside hydrolase/deacetylase ChbG (UPF0249 family)